ncbi:MAG: hypothetical protein U5K69_22350 [Balneolaceae bacterium]|nr:hypothetical protein [Balneolaceae bacterium]
MKFRSAISKVERSRELIEKITKAVKNNPPYTYWLGRNLKTGESFTYSKCDEDVLDKIVIHCGDVFHNLRSALDHAYFEAVSPEIEDESKHDSIQFPFAKDSTSLESAIKTRHAHKVSHDFYKAIESLKPFNGKDGNTLLYLIHKINIIDKHRSPTPVGDFTKISSSQIRRQVPDFPLGLNIGVSQTTKDVVWYNDQYNFRKKGFKKIPPDIAQTQKRLNVQVDLIFNISEPQYRAKVVHTLNDMAKEVERTLNVMEDAL